MERPTHNMNRGKKENKKSFSFYELFTEFKLLFALFFSPQSNFYIWNKKETGQQNFKAKEGEKKSYLTWTFLFCQDEFYQSHYGAVTSHTI